MRFPKERAAVQSRPVTLAKQLFAEGETPANFFEALLEDIGLSNSIEIHNYGGDRELRVYLRTLAATESFRANVKSILVTRDADTDPNAARNSVNYAIQHANIPSSIIVSTFILPTDTSIGMIEDLCVEAIRNTPQFSCIDEFVACLAIKNIPIPNTPIRSKHIAQMYLATTKDPQVFPGTAAKKKIWPLDNPVFDPLKALLRAL